MANINKKGFQYIWAFSSEKTIFKMSEAVSPYLEINSECLNKSNLQKKSEIEVNPYLTIYFLILIIILVNLLVLENLQRN